MSTASTSACRAGLLIAAAALLGTASGCGDTSTPPDGGCTVDCEERGQDGGRTERDAGQELPFVEDPAEGGDGGVTRSTYPTLTDYLRCSSDVDCPVELGDCVKSVPFNRAVDGRSHIALSELDDRIAPGQGVCSRSCTLDQSACGQLSLRNDQGARVPFTCQLVAVGPAPYPEPPPPFPFADSLDVAALTAGQPFAALCRPPFELDPAVPDDVCATCDDTTACGGLCLDTTTGAPRVPGATTTGICLPPAPADRGCPVGFEPFSAEDAEGTFCAPLVGTCGACLDRDNDGTGTGHCASSSYDCNDRNPLAYFSATSPNHPFPHYCGQHDLNCNGLSDDAEQVGQPAWLAYHCEFCGDDAHGRVVNAGTASEASLACVNGTLMAETCATEGRIHCSGDVRQTGCEATGDVGGIVYFRDRDGDGYGNDAETSLACPGGEPASGYVAVGGDCNDADSAIHPAAADVCECWGDCATPGARVDNNCNGTFDEDAPAYLWFTDEDLDGAPGEVAFGGVRYCGLPAVGSYLPGLTEDSGRRDCSDTEAARFGDHQRVTDASFEPLPLPLASPPPRDAAGNLFFSSAPAHPEICDSLDNDCDGVTDNGVQTVFFRDQDNDGYGDPAVTVSACTAPPGYVSNADDCDDNDPDRNPSVAELCDGIDQNCNELVDEDVPLGQACSTGLLGACEAGTITSCTGGVYQCTQLNAPQLFDDPDPSTPEDEDCDGPELTVYVDTSGNDANDGSMAMPMATIGGAQARALQLGYTRIALSGGRFETEHSLADGMELVGGYSRIGNEFRWTGNSSSVVRNPTAPSGTLAYALEVPPNASATLAHLNVSVQQNDKAGVDQVGLYLRGPGTVFLRDLIVDVEKGRDGVPGTPGAAGANGPRNNDDRGGQRTCNGENVRGGNGVRARVGEDGKGQFPGQGRGGDGYNGKPNPVAGAALPAQAQSFGGSFEFLQPTPTVAGDGKNGSGGGAGGGGSVGMNDFAGGGGSAGGCAGAGGSAGGAGGSSIAIFDLGKTNVIYDNSIPGQVIDLTVRGGGAGGAGGPGGAGGSSEKPKDYVFSTGGYGSGGTGGAGGSGGPGGWSFPLYVHNSADYCSDAGKLSAVIFNTTAGAGLGGAAGPGGAGGFGGVSNTGEGNAPSGEAGEPGVAGRSAACGFTQQ